MSLRGERRMLRAAAIALIVSGIKRLGLGDVSVGHNFMKLAEEYLNSAFVISEEQ